MRKVLFLVSVLLVGAVGLGAWMLSAYLRNENTMQVQAYVYFADKMMQVTGNALLKYYERHSVFPISEGDQVSTASAEMANLLLDQSEKQLNIRVIPFDPFPPRVTPEGKTATLIDFRRISWELAGPPLRYYSVGKAAIVASVGPDLVPESELRHSFSAETSSSSLLHLHYDPTNGLVSRGDIFWLLNPRQP